MFDELDLKVSKKLVAVAEFGETSNDLKLLPRLLGLESYDMFYANIYISM